MFDRKDHSTVDDQRLTGGCTATGSIVAGFKAGCIGAALLAFAGPATALSLDLGVAEVNIGSNDDDDDEEGGGLDVGVNLGGGGGVDVGVGIGGGGVDAGVSIGGDSGINADVNLGGDTSLGVDVSLGGGTGGGTGTGGDNGTGIPGTIMPSQRELSPAQNATCPSRGNSQSMNDYLVFDTNGRAMGVVHGVVVGSNLQVQQVIFATSANFYKPVRCLTLPADNMRIGNRAIALPYTSNQIARLIATQ